MWLDIRGTHLRFGLTKNQTRKQNPKNFDCMFMRSYIGNAFRYKNWCIEFFKRELLLDLTDLRFICLKLNYIRFLKKLSGSNFLFLAFLGD
jgi:hypothetical protein